MWASTRNVRKHGVRRMIISAPPRTSDASEPHQSAACPLFSMPRSFFQLAAHQQAASAIMRRTFRSPMLASTRTLATFLLLLAACSPEQGFCLDSNNYPSLHCAATRTGFPSDQLPLTGSHCQAAGKHERVTGFAVSPAAPFKISVFFARINARFFKFLDC